MGRLTLSGLFVYPVEPLAGIAVEQAALAFDGLALDRRWTLADGKGRGLEPRSHPRLGLIRPAFTAAGLTLSAPRVPDLEIGFDEGGDGPARWLSAFLETECRLVPLDAEDRGPNGPATLSILSEASLNDLNRQLARPVPLEDFRPHLVIRGCGPHAETSWRRIAVGAASFRLTGPRTECPALAAIDGGAVLQQLEAYRRRQPGAAFGVNARPDNPGEIRTGTRVDLLA
jgi:uncharacterized protein YcbX